MIRYIYIYTYSRFAQTFQRRNLYHIISYNLSKCEVKLSISLLALNTQFTHEIISFAMVLFFAGNS